MKADLTRDSSNVLRHYSQVLMQQGRVQLDADWNEQGKILLTQLRSTAAEIIGPAGGRPTEDWPQMPGFGIVALPSATPPNADFIISHGRYFVDGILCELAAEYIPVSVASDGKSVVVQRWNVDGRSLAVDQYIRVAQTPQDAGVIAKITAAEYDNLTLTVDPAITVGGGKPALLQRITTYRTQPDIAGNAPNLPTDSEALVYLDVWEMAVTSLEEPAMREIALGSSGPDTAARVRTIAQVRILPKMERCQTPDEIARLLSKGNPGLLRAQAQPAAGSKDICTIDPDAGYRGPENQLYRVEIHTGANKTPSFKWSRENGSVLFDAQDAKFSTDSILLTLASLGRDDRFGLAEGDYVELETDATVLAPQPPVLLPLFQVKSIDRAARHVTLTPPKGYTPTAPSDPLPAIRLRRWDHKGDVGADNCIPIPVTGQTPMSDWIDLEDGIQVQFALLHDVFYRPRDYWLIPARVVTGDIIWPKETWTDAQGAVQTGQAVCPPNGVTHHYAPLGLINLFTTAAPAVARSCQPPFQANH